MTLRRADGIARVNVCRIVLPHTDIQEMLNAVDNASAMLFKRTYSVSNSVPIIKDNWRVRPNFKANYKANQKCMAYIAVLSEALCGQHLLGEDAV
jgi:hypothetical protein